jgi:ankyrin repeat protein
VHGADVNARRRDHWTPLHLASLYGRAEAARLLLDHGANANAEDKYHRTSLHLVATGSYPADEDGVQLLHLLLERGVDVNAQDIFHETPLHLASCSGKLEIVRVLLQHPAVRNDRGQSSSHIELEGEFYRQT